MRRLIPQLTIACGAVAGIVFALVPEIDLRVARWFYDSAAPGFTLGNTPVFVFLRNLNTAIDYAIGAVLVGAIVLTLVQPWRRLVIPGRAIIFVTATYLLIPVFLANVVFKAHSARPRPYQITQFGAPLQFVPWWDPRGQCTRNCSFFSGEVSSAAWTLGPAALLPMPWRVPAIAGALVLTATIAVVRMAAGGHFLSDTVFAVVITVLMLWVAYDIIYRRLRPSLTDEAIDRWLTVRGLRLREWFCRRSNQSNG